MKRLDPLPLPTPSVPDEPLDLGFAAPKHGYLAAALKFLGEGEWCDAGIGAIYAQVEDEARRAREHAELMAHADEIARALVESALTRGEAELMRERRERAARA